MGDLWSPGGWRDRRSGRAFHAPPPRRSESRSRLLLLAVLCAAWLGLLIWPGPQLGAFLSAQTARLAHATGASISRVVTAGTSHLPGATAPGGGVHLAWQVGVAAVGAPDQDTGVRTTIVTRVPQRVSDQTINYFWIGAYLSDGSFVQAGYYVPWNDSGHAGWFYCAFHAGGQKGPCALGPAGSAGANGSRHTYTIETLAGEIAGASIWHVTMDGAMVGQFAWSVGDTGAYMPGIYAESSGKTAHSATSQVGPVDFSGGIQVRPAGQTEYVAAPHAQAQYNAADVCPPYGVAADRSGGALLGSGEGCLASGSLVW